MAKAQILNSNKNKSTFVYFKSIFKAFLFTAVIMLIFAAIITFTSVSESIMPLVTSIIMVLSVAFSGLLTARKFQKNGFLHGIVTGAIYVLFIIFLSWIFINSFSMDKYVIIRIAIGIISGGIGGMIGVNLK